MPYKSLNLIQIHHTNFTLLAFSQFNQTADAWRCAVDVVAKITTFFFDIV